MKMDEQWRSIPGYVGIYEVSDTGRVRSIDHATDIAPTASRSGYTRIHRGRVLQPKFDRHGYPVADLSKGGVVKRFGNHQLVLLAFRGPRPEGMVARHLNGDCTDPRLENLDYGTYVDNSADMKTHGTVYQLNKTHCPQGHEYAGDNLYRWRNRRMCKACHNSRSGRRKRPVKSTAAAVAS